MEVLQSDRKGKRILWFEELGKEDIPLVGGKNANLGEMLRAKISKKGRIVREQTVM